MKKQLPYGLANFERIATENFFYVDKTMYIETIETVRFPVFLRPRRFGKSLFTQILRCYYDIKLKDRFDEIFGKYYIGKNPTPKRNQFFFLSFAFTGMDIYADMEELELKKKFDLSLLKSLYAFLLHYKDYFGFTYTDIDRIENKFQNNGEGGIAYLLGLVKSLGKRTYIVIDEYDSLTNALAIRYRETDDADNMYLKILSKGGFFRNFFEMLKRETETSIEQIYITGILPITITDMTSGFNIANWIHFNPRFQNMLGITKPEFDTLIDEVYTEYPEITHDKETVKQVIKKYYNGYRFLPNSEEVYNPMMTLYFLESLALNNQYPTELADANLKMNYDQIAFIIGQNHEGAKEIITQITENRSITTNSTLRVTFDMKNYKEGTYIIEGLYFAGILTHSKKYKTLKIPNTVTYTFALDYFAEVQDFKYDRFSVDQWFTAYISDSDVNALIEGFFKDVIQKFPGVFFRNASESFYHGLLYYMIDKHTDKSDFEVLPEYNLPTGQADIMLKTYPHSRAPQKMNDLFELKQVAKGDSDAKLNAKLQEAINDIKQYRTGEYANWRGIAVCFRGNSDYIIKVIE